MTYLRYGNDRELINPDMAEFFLKKGLLKDEFEFDNLTGGPVYSLGDDWDLADYEMAAKLWKERYLERRKKRIEDLLSEEEIDQGEPQESGDNVRIAKAHLLDTIEHFDWVHDNDPSDYFRGYRAALNDLKRFVDDF